MTAPRAAPSIGAVPGAEDNGRASRPVDDAALQQFLLFLASAMTAAGEAVNEIEGHLYRVAKAYGATEARFAVLPTFAVVALDPNRPATLEPTAQLRGGLRLDQTSAVYDVLRHAQRGDVEPSVGTEQLLAAVEMDPRFGAVPTVVGHVVLTVGLCLTIQPRSWADIALAAAFGVLVGCLRLVDRSARLRMVMPALASFIVAGVTFALADHGWVDADVRVMIAPLVTFLPGAALTMSIVELSAAELVTGVSRLASGILQLTLLAFGIVAAADTVGLPASGLADVPANGLGWWAPWVGVLVFGAGVFVYNSAPSGSLPWLLIVLLVAFVGQRVGNDLLGGYLGGFVGAFLMTPTAKAIENTDTGPPTLVTFLPAFWLLVPGALAVIGVTEFVSSDHQVGSGDFLGTAAAILSIALGVLCGYPFVDSVERTARRIRSVVTRSKGDPTPT